MIIVDSRELRSKIKEELEKLHVPVTVDTLDVGDYLVCGTNGEVCISRKEAGDFAGSLTTGHLSNELYNMSLKYPYSIFLFEGVMTEALMFRKLSRQSYMSGLIGVAMKRSSDGLQGIVHVIPCDTVYDTALALYYIHEKLNTEDGLLRAPILPSIKLKDKDRQLMIVAALPNIGEVRAKVLLNKFKSLRALSDATVEQMCEVKGIGPTIAKGIYDTWRNEYE